MLRVLYLEPFDAGSHAAFGRALRAHVDAAWTVLALPGRHWKWRMRGAVLHFAERRADALAGPHDVVLASSFTPLGDLVALAPRLATVPKVLYFHENQWTYPVREERERDRHYGFTQLVSALAADRCLFNSQHNRDGFLRASREAVERMPDARPTRLVAALAERCEVLPLPVELTDPVDAGRRDVAAGDARARGPCVLWNHRWEHDKDPETFFAVLERLAADGVPFRLAVCGETFRAVPDVFGRARRSLAARIVHWGFASARGDYLRLLESAQIAVSTARHEFFGLSMLEATHAGAYPLVPDRLAYPELFPRAFRYGGPEELSSRLADLCIAWRDGRIDLRCDRSAITATVAAARVAPALAACLRRVADHRPR